MNTKNQVRGNRSQNSPQEQGKKAASNGATRPSMTAEEGAALLQERHRIFNSRIEFDLYTFAVTGLTDEALLALLAEVITDHEAGLRGLVRDASLRSRCNALAAVNIARAVTKRARGIGWFCLNEDAAGDSFTGIVLDAGLPGMSGRGFLTVRNASAVLADFLYDNRQEIIDKIIGEMTDLGKALEVAEGLVVAEKECHRSGLPNEIEGKKPGELTSMEALALRLFEASQQEVVYDPSDFFWRSRQEQTPMGFSKRPRRRAALHAMNRG
jgi:hypothetical protein